MIQPPSVGPIVGATNHGDAEKRAKACARFSGGNVSAKIDRVNTRGLAAAKTLQHTKDDGA